MYSFPFVATFAVRFNHPNQMDVDCWPGYGPAGPHTRLPADKYHPLRKRRTDGPEREGAVASVGRFQGMPNGMLLKSTRGQCTCPGPKCFNYKNEISQNCCADIFDIAGCPRTLGIVGQTMRNAWQLHEPSVCPRGKQKKQPGKQPEGSACWLSPRPHFLTPYYPHSRTYRAQKQPILSQTIWMQSPPWRVRVPNGRTVRGTSNSIQHMVFTHSCIELAWDIW